MAERRMFSKSIVDSDAFLELPCTAQTLYFHLCIKADDDGFSNTPQKTKKLLGASDSDLELLENGGFIISFDSGVVVIRHWKVHNYVRKDTYKKTLYSKEMDELFVSEDGIYYKKSEYTDDFSADEDFVDEPSTSRQRTVDEPSTQDRIGKESLGKDSIVEDRIGEESPSPCHQTAGEKTTVTFSEGGSCPENNNKKTDIFPPSFETVEKYCRERGNKIDVRRFYKFYTERDWKIEGRTMSDWRACVRGWEAREYKRPPPYADSGGGDGSFDTDSFFKAAVSNSYRNMNIQA